MRILKTLAGILALLVLGLVIWLAVKPPELLRLGTAYAAKIVCSNVFIAGRDADAVLADDVQAPGNPLLKLLNVSVDQDTKTVTTYFLGFFAPSSAAYRPGLGCANIHGKDLRPAHGAISKIAPQPIDIAIDPAIQELVEKPGLAGPGIRAIVVMHDGKLIAERYGPGFSAQTPLLGWSMTKSVMATLIGMRIAEGRMALIRYNLFPQWKTDGRSQITLANLMAMESGLRFDENYGTVTDVTRMLFLEQDMAGFAASMPLVTAPATHFNYSSGTANILSRLFMQSFENGKEALDFPMHALFDPLGLSNAVLEMDASGTFAGSSYMYATARDWARIGAFLANGGVIDGKRLLPEGFVSFMAKPSQASLGRYGSAMVWRQISGVRAGTEGIPKDAFWMFGHDGQSVMIVPSLNLAVARLGLTPSRTGYNVQNLNAAIVKALYP
ncbi:serine hydrolase [Brucella sp. 2280]|uniref:serine hydrolase domain-containing protein n=1 Tax=Brucella sp. 2280 TaxID=2592625 RepID=UPI001295F33C|nr:serine hydrolase [Brucella sp. 2280]QGA55794.1 serine hydrolase [Brucella sp. 2280]